MPQIPFFIPSLHPKTFLVGKTKAFPRAMTFQVLATVLLEFCWYKLEEIQLKVAKAKKEIYWLITYAKAGFRYQLIQGSEDVTRNQLPSLS